MTGNRIGSGILPDQLQEKLETLENEIMEAKRNSFLGGSFNESVGAEEFTEYDQPDIYSESLPPRRASTAMPECGRRYSSIPPGIAAEVGGGSRSSTRSGSSRGSRSGVADYLFSIITSSFPRYPRSGVAEYHFSIISSVIPLVILDVVKLPRNETLATYWLYL